jgi:uncharacterized protein (DUF39 family)
MEKSRTIKEINDKIKKGIALVMTADEIIDLVDSKGIDLAFEHVDVVTTATFGPMCSSGAFLNFGHSDPPIRMERITLNDVPASGGLAAVDTYIGAAEDSRSNPGSYGGAHVICDLIAGKSVLLEAHAKGTDCYPTTSFKREIKLEDMNEAFLFNPRNAYQNYTGATNLSDKPIFTYMGTLLPHGKNVTYSTTGQLSPLLNDPYLRSIGIGTRIFLAGAEGYVSWNGTQSNTSVERYPNGIPKKPAATLSVTGDMKEMDPEFISAAVFTKYGISLNVGIGIPIPITNLKVLHDCAVRDSQIQTDIVDYSVQRNTKSIVKTVTYEMLRSGSIEIDGRSVKTAPLSSLYKARKIADLLKKKITAGDFLITQPVKMFPVDHHSHSLDEGGGFL